MGIDALEREAAEVAVIAAPHELLIAELAGHLVNVPALKLARAFAYLVAKDNGFDHHASLLDTMRVVVQLSPEYAEALKKLAQGEAEDA